MLAAIASAFVGAAGVSALLAREPQLEGHSVRYWVREAAAYSGDLYPGATGTNSAAAEVFRRSPAKAVPALVKLMAPEHRSLSTCLAHELMAQRRIYERLPTRLLLWKQAVISEAEKREADRKWAIVWCASLGPAATAAHTAFLKACEDGNWQVREEAARALIRTDAPPSLAIPLLSKMLLQDSNVCVRYWAAASLELVPEEAQPAIPALRRATHDSNQWFASRAREALRRIEAATTPKDKI
jgi:hypothetical protein